MRLFEKEHRSFSTEVNRRQMLRAASGIAVASSAGIGMTSTATAQQISYGAPIMHYSTDSDPPQHATNLTVLFNPEVTFGGGSEYELEVERVDTNQSVRFEPNISQEITASNAGLFLYDGDGTLLDPPEIDLDGRKPLSVTGGNENIFTSESVFGTYIVHLLENGERINSMEEKQIGIGYEGEFVQDSTSGEIEVTFPIEDEVDDSWYVEFYIDDHGDSPPSDLIEATEMERDEEREQFVSTFQSDNLDSVDEDSVPRGEVRFFINGNPYEAEEYYEPNLWLGFSIDLSSAEETVIFQQFSDAADSPLFWALGGLAGAGVGYAGYRKLNSDENSNESHDKDRSIATEKPTNTEQQDIKPVIKGYEDLELFDTVKTFPTIRIRRAETADRRLWVLEPNIEAEGTLDTSTIDRLVNDIEPWSQMNSHSNLLSVFKSDTEPFPWAAIEFADSPKLLDHVDELSMTEKLEAIQEICDAVHHVSRYGTPYENLTTKSILYPNDSGAKLQGILDQFGAQNEWYMAPEEFTAKSTEQSMVYRLGLITYELLTGTLPYATYPNGNPEEAIRSDDPIQPSEQVASLPPEIDRILLKSLSKTQESRHETVLHFRDELRKFAHE